MGGADMCRGTVLLVWLLIILPKYCSPGSKLRGVETLTHHHLQARQLPSGAEHFYLNREAVKTLAVGGDLAGRHRREVGPLEDPLSLTETLSRNVTRILEELLLNYDQTERPPPHVSPTEVKVSIFIRSMGPISEANMYYSMDCYFRQYWRDTRLSFQGLSSASRDLHINQLSLNVKMLEKIWKPDTFFHNGLDSYLHTITRPNKLFRISEEGDITYSMRLTIKAKCPMMLSSFPMDWQSCPLIFGSFAYPMDQVIYRWHDPQMAVGYEGELQLSQFEIMGTKYREINYTRGDSAGGSYSVLQVIFVLQRNTGYFLIQVYVPCTLIVVLSWVGFWLNREATSDRVGLGITAVLTLSTISLQSRTELPKVHYATALDWFIICSFFYCMATLLEFAGVHYFTKIGSGEIFSIADERLQDQHEKEEQWQEEEEQEMQEQEAHKHEDHKEQEEQGSTSFSPVAAAFNSVYGVASSSFISGCDLQTRVCPAHPHGQAQSNSQAMHNGRNTKAYQNNGPGRRGARVGGQGANRVTKGQQTEPRPSFLKQLSLCFLSNQDFRKLREKDATRRGVVVNSSSKIDKVARTLFPASFTVFNIIYWCSYFQSNKSFDWSDHKLIGERHWGSKE